MPSRFWEVKSSDDYDYKSIMHYNSDLGGALPSPILFNKASGAEIGVNKELSALDIQSLRLLYPCDNKNYTCGQNVIPNYGPVDDRTQCKIQRSCSDGKLSKVYKSYKLAQIYCERVYPKTCDIIVNLGNDRYEIGSLKNCCNGPCKPISMVPQTPSPAAPKPAAPTPVPPTPVAPKVSTPTTPKSTPTSPTTTTTTVAKSSHCNAGYVSGDMANHIRIGPIGPIKCASSWSNDKWNSVLMTKAFTDLNLASIYCERVYIGQCDTIIEYKRGKSTDDWIYEIGSTKTALCPTGNLGDICIKIHKV